MEQELVWIKAVESVHEGQSSFFKFISANDSGETGGHQAGFLIPKSAISAFINEPLIKGENFCKRIQIEWEDGFMTNSVFRYYGQKTRDEYRLTRFGNNFNFRERIQTGDLLVMSRMEAEYYRAFILKSEEEIDSFLEALGLNPVDSGTIITISPPAYEINEENEFGLFFQSLRGRFPTTLEMANAARELDLKIHDKEHELISDPDKKILDWTAFEYRLFRYVEKGFYEEPVKRGFDNLEHFLELANSLLNRRKSRAGKSLEHHLSSLFLANKLSFSEQERTEGNSRPDFIFPGITQYHDHLFPRDKILVLAAKTTCKDRWRQILTEAKNLNRYYLFTLQQGITANQLDEMKAANVQLIVPKAYISSYPATHRSSLMTLKNFIGLLK